MSAARPLPHSCGRSAPPWTRECDCRSLAAWSAAARAGGPIDRALLTVEVADPGAPSAAERDAIRKNCRRFNMSLYRTAPGAVDPAALSAFAAALGLVRRNRTLDADPHGVAAISADPARAVEGYIPYSTRALNWHTDGYYLAPPERVGAVVMHCARPARSGGANELLDPERVWLALAEIDARFPRALARPDAFTIPAREDAGGEARAAVTGPVFSVDAPTGALHMRYTARTRSIEWCADPMVREAQAALREAIGGAFDNRLRVTLRAGEGMVRNNVLHRRDGYDDAGDRVPGRLLYRIRALNRVEGT